MRYRIGHEEEYWQMTTNNNPELNRFADIDNAKSYATEANLMKALEKLGLANLRPLVVCNRKGRFTAVFGLHLSGMAQTGNVMFAANHGFKTID
jgi:hypothetical protein